MTPKLYMSKISPPVRAVLMCAKAIDLELDLVEVNLFERDHLKPEYMKLNPMHTVPTMDDNGFILTDSHAIMGYLIGTYAKDSSLYPKHVKKRAAIDQKMFFDSSISFARGRKAVFSIFFHGATAITEENIKSLEECYGFIEAFLQDSKYIAGDNLSIADFSVITSLINSRVLVPFSKDKYPNISAWMNLMEALPYYDINRVGEEIVIAAAEARLHR